MTYYSNWTERHSCVRPHMAHWPEFVLYEGAGKPRFDFEATRLPFEPEMRQIPLFGHSWITVTLPSGPGRAGTSMLGTQAL